MSKKNVYQILNDLLEGVKSPFNKVWDNSFFRSTSFFTKMVNPGNTITLKNLDSDWQETDVLMEECIFQLLFDFFNSQQPVNLHLGLSIRKNQTLKQQLDLLTSNQGEFDSEKYIVLQRLLNIAIRWQNGYYSTDDYKLWVQTNGSFSQKEKIVADFKFQKTSDLIFVISNREMLWT